MAASSLKLPGPFEDSTIYSLSGQTLREWCEALQADRVIPGNGQDEHQTPQGRVITDVASVNALCELGGIVGGKITPGYVIGGGASQLIDIGAVTPVANTTYYVICQWTADLEDGVVGPGGTMGAVTFNSGASVPDDVVPNAASAAGTAYAPVVGWDEDLNRVGAGCGAITIGFCPGGFLKGRQS